MKGLRLSLLLSVYFAAVLVYPLQAEMSTGAMEQDASKLRAVEKADALAPGIDAPTSVMRDTPAVPLEVASQIVGDVVSVDPPKGTLTVREEGTGKTHTLTAINAGILETLKAGSKVRVSIPAEKQAAPTVFKS